MRNKKIIHSMKKMALALLAVTIMTSSINVLGDEETTTKTVQAATTTAWSKNSDGQYVNGNGDVIEGATMKGVDVSKWNGDIDWSKVAASDVEFAIIRCGYGDNLVSQDDTYWEANVTGCEENNIPYGVYIYSYATTIAQAQSEAEHVLRLIEGHTLNFPIYYDMEDSCQAGLTEDERTEIANTFLSAILAEGYECGIYANLNWWNNYLSTSLAEQITWKWVAQYNNIACSYTGKYQMWQCTSEGSVNGISKNVDINFWFGEVRTRLYNIKSTVKTTSAKTVKAPGRVTIKYVKTKKKKATVKLKKVSGAKGYQIQYSTEKGFKKKYRKTTKTTKTKTVIKGLKSKTKYYFRVRAYKKSSGKRIYSKKWSKVTKVKTK